MKKHLIFVGLTLIFAACGTKTQDSAPDAGTSMEDNGMMSRHHAAVPSEYAGLTNPIPADSASLERGGTLYATNCASCHGDGGMGDGPAASALDPAPAPVAYSSQMLADDYLFWRLSEGGVAFGTSMPAWKTLDEEARWDMINYMRALGTGAAAPASSLGGEAYDPEVQAAQQAELLAQAVEQGVISQSEADTFNFVHTAVEKYRIEHPEIINRGGDATEREATIMASLVESNVLTQAQADAFTDIHDRLGASGLMP
jgi:mono/diheme cytochrome c family protein